MSELPRVGLSLSGCGRVVTLTPQSVRRVFHLFMNGTQRTKREMIANLRHDWLTDRDQPAPVAKRLLSPSGGLLSVHEIARLESCFNMLAIRSDWRLLSRQECLIDSSANVCVRSDTIDRRRSNGVFFNGACFEVRPIDQCELLRGGQRDVFVEDTNRELRFLRFNRVTMHRGVLNVEICSRYEVDFKWLEPLSEFRPRRILSILRAQPLPGFHFSEIAPFLNGRS